MPSRRRSSRHPRRTAADENLTSAQPSESALELGHRIVEIAATVRDQYPPRLPSEHPLVAGTRLRLSSPGCHLHLARRLSRPHGGTEGKQPPEARLYALWFKRHDHIREDQRRGVLVAEHDLFDEAAASEDELFEVVRPGLRGAILEVGVEGNVELLRACSLTNSRGSPDRRVRVARLPGWDGRVVEPVRRHEVLDTPERIDFREQFGRGRRGRPEPQAI